MRKRYLVQAIFCSLLGAEVALAQEEGAAAAAPAPSQEAAELHDKLRTMSPEQRRAYLEEQHAKMREQAEAAMPPAPVPPPPMLGRVPEPAVPGAEEARQRHEKLKAMDPEERREYLREESEQRRKQAEAAVPSPPAPPPMAPLAGAAERYVPSPEEVRQRHEELKAMTPEQRRARLQEESEQRRAEAAAAIPAPPTPPAPVFGSEGQIPPATRGYERMRNMTPEQRRAYRDQRYQELRQQAAAEGLDLPETPPWAQQPPPGPGIRYMSDDERTAHWEAMSEMTPEERAVYRAEHHQRIMERAQAQAQPPGVEPPEVPEWVKQRWQQAEAVHKKIDAMSPEDREACFAMHRLMQGRGMGRRWRAPLAPGVGQGYPPAAAPELPPAAGGPDYPPASYGPGYGYGPESGWGRGYGYGPGPGYGQDYPSAPGYGYGPRPGPRPGY